MKNGLGIMDVDISNSLCMSLCTENIWSFCGAEFGPGCVAVVVLKQGLCYKPRENDSSNSIIAIRSLPILTKRL